MLVLVMCLPSSPEQLPPHEPEQLQLQEVVDLLQEQAKALVHKNCVDNLFHKETADNGLPRPLTRTSVAWMMTETHCRPLC
jgi:hypothetical protein